MVAGYAVVDVETTGLHPGFHHRVVEVAVVHVDRRGRVVDEWCTLVNPERDLGPQHVHGITAGQARQAPTFAEITGDLGGRLAGHVVVGHNVSFDLGFLSAEFRRAGLDVPLTVGAGLCTMKLAGRYLAAATRSLAACCEAAGVDVGRAHSALHDAHAAAALFGHFLRAAGRPEPWRDRLDDAELRPWPVLPPPTGRVLPRGTNHTPPAHFLARLVDGMPRVPHPPRADEYLSVLDGALLDRHLSATEQAELVSVAGSLGLGRADVERLHGQYLVALARRAWADEVVTREEQADLRLVAVLLGLSEAEADEALATARDAQRPHADADWGGFRLGAGDAVVFTGQMSLPRETWEARAVAAGLTVRDQVTKKTRLVVAADPDSLSGKAKKANGYGIPIVAEDAFERLLDAVRVREVS
ncbi:DNA polymerase-3 subunit epsilon [Saccharothrix saharensis]|uniref:DNA polymerase-3 subunit epsilon n=1 Tax=Saccharothrix saharensis TaxID=571190 RepID=A0A543JLU3_9PSEU|nr:exonuclease domain-containing protein [Saccharothrix saharensis]TQM83734.1 DNA polymerase-3 subunit epsilon [Saccharothrix saharensis]